MLVLLQAQVEVWSYLLDENVNVSLLLYCNRDMITINPNHLKVAYVHMGHNIVIMIDEIFISQVWREQNIEMNRLHFNANVKMIINAKH